MHLALDSDVRVGDGSGEELSQRAEEEGDSRSDLPGLFDPVLHLLEESVLKNRVDDEDQRWENAGEQSRRSLVLEEQHQSADGGGSFGLGRLDAGLYIGVLVLLAGGDAGVDDPDGVGHDDRGGPSNGAGDHGLDGGELLIGAAGLGGGLLEEITSPLVPVVVDEVGDADAEQGRVDAGVQPGYAFSGDDLLHGIDELALSFLGLDLSSGGECDERVSK